jgi:hypothetical protein
MLPVAGLLWKVLPKMEFMQFPWRWLLCLSMILSVFVTMVRRLPAGAALVVARGGVRGLDRDVITAGSRVQAPWWDNAADLREMQDNMATGAGYEGSRNTRRWAPIRRRSILRRSATSDAATRTDNGPSNDRVRWQRRRKVPGRRVRRFTCIAGTPESRMFTAEMSAPDQLALRLFQYPAWRVEVNGHVVDTSGAEGTGQMLVPVAAGLNRVEISFVRTWDRTLGGWISVIAADLGWRWMDSASSSATASCIGPSLGSG